jgi:hypothetical protein
MKLDRNYLDQIILEALKKKKKEEETKEATGAASAGGYSAPAFSMWSEDDEAKSEYKKQKDTKKIEATEATTSSSVGAYDANSFQNINMKGNTTKGQGRSWKKSQIPGGEFVSIKEKCKTFPYCNQGDINAITRSKKPKKNAMYEAIKNVSIKTGLTEEEIKNILINHLGDNL